jgi:hypothetical protein
MSRACSKESQRKCCRCGWERDVADQHPYCWMRRDADDEYVVPIIEHLKPLNNPYPHYGNPEEYVAHEVQCTIFFLRDIYLPCKYQTKADRDQLVSLLRQFEYHKLADEVRRRGSYTVSPPPRSDAKYYCALQAAVSWGISQSGS